MTSVSSSTSTRVENDTHSDTDPDHDEQSPLLSRTYSGTSPTSPWLVDQSRWRFWLVFTQVLLTQFMSTFDSSITASSHPVITSYFGASRYASWLATSFLLTSTAFQPVLGRLSDAVGRKPLFIACLALFAVATTWCALAGSMESLIVARAVCGIGGGGFMTLGSIIVSDIVPIERRGLYHPYSNVAYALGTTLGAALGGIMAEKLGWRWEFGIQVPIVLVCLCISLLAIPSDLGTQHGHKTVREALSKFDIKGSLLLSTSMIFLIMGLSLGGNLYPWSHPIVIGSLIAFAVCAAAFILVESRVDNPIIPLKLLYRPPRANIIFGNFIASILQNSVMFNMPLYYQAVLLTSATTSGLRLMFLSVVYPFCSITTGLGVNRTRRLKWPLIIGSTSYLLGMIAISLLNRNLPWIYSMLVLIFPASGIGFQYIGSFLAILAASTQAEQATVSSTLIMWRSLGSVFGIAASSLVVQNALGHYLTEYVHGERKNEIIASVRQSVEVVKSLDQPYRDQAVQSYEAALRLTFICCAGLALVSVLLLLPIKLPRLQSKGKGIARR